MKKIIVLLFTLASFSIFANTWTDPNTGITWRYTISDGEASVGGGSSSSTAVTSSTTGAITIPSTLGGCPVTSICEWAFSSCSGLTSVTIPDSVTSIGDYAFRSCSGLTSVTIPSSVTSIGIQAFYGCSGLTSVTISEGVTSICEWAFFSCSGLTSVTIPDSVTSIGDYAFRSCSGLKSVTILEGVMSIGNYAFEACSGLKEVHINDVAAWCKISFGDSYANPLCYAHRLYLGDEEVTDLTIPDGVTCIANSAFSGCSGLTSVTIPSSVTSIGSYAFSGCSGLTSVTIPEGVTSIGWCVFSGCSGLTSVTIPSSVTSIGDYAFNNCSGLTSVTIPSSVTSIGSSALSGCSGLTSVTIPSSVTRIGSSAFSGCSGLTSVTIPSSVASIGSSAFSGCSGLTSVTIPSSVASIGSNAFYNCSGLTSVTIPKGVTNIGDGAFRGCSGLSDVNGFVIVKNVLHDYCGNETSVTIPSSVTRIGSSAFYGCSGLTSVMIPDSVTSIGNYAFRSCSGLKSVTILEGVMSIGNYAFEACSGLKEVHINDVAAWCKISFGGSYANPLCYAHRLYLGDEEVTDLIIPESVTGIGNYAFYGCSGLTSVTIPSSMTSIGSSAFEGCRNLEKVIVDSLDSFGKISFGSMSANPMNVGNPTLYVGDEKIEGTCQVTFNVLCGEEEYDIPYGFIRNSDGTMDYAQTLTIEAEIGKGIDGPEVESYDWNHVFDKWDDHHFCVTSDTTINAVWRRKTIDEACDEWQCWPSGTIEYSFDDNGFCYLQGKLDSWSLDFLMYNQAKIEIEAVCYGYGGVYRKKCLLSDAVCNDGAFMFVGNSVKTDIVGDISIIIRSSEFDGEREILYVHAYEFQPISAEHYQLSLNWADGEMVVHNVKPGNFVDISYQDYNWYNNPRDATLTMFSDYFTIENGTNIRVYVPRAEDDNITEVRTIELSNGSYTSIAYVDPAGYRVHFDLGTNGVWVGGGELEQVVLCDELAEAPIVEGKKGWRFIGWDGDTSIGITSATTFTAQYEPIEYAITYANDRGMNNPNPSTYTILDAITFLPLAEKSGLRFVEWDKPSIALGSIGDITVTASWEECELQDIVDIPNDSISFGGDADWLLVYVDGRWTMRSGMITKSQSSYCDIKFTGPAKVSFSMKVSCEAQNGEDMTDGMELLVDGESILYISGITNWEDKYIDVLGEGEHTVRWCYSKDNKTDEGDDCCYVSDVVVTPIYTIEFTDGGADDGETPIALNVWKDGEYTLPDCGTLHKAKYAFVGWKLGEVVYPAGTTLTATESVEFTAVWEAKVLPMPIVDVAEYYTTEKTTVTIDYGVDGVTGYYKLDGGEPMIYEGPFEIEGTHTIVAYAIHEDYFDSALTEEYSTVRAPWTIGECLNYDGVFGDTTWVRDLEVSHDGKAAMRSGAIGNKESSQLTIAINGSARVSFWIKTSSEYDADDGEVYDGFVCYIDGVAQNEKLIGGEIDWQELSFDVVGAGEHILTLSYEKDKSGSGGEDCVWIDEIKVASVYEILFKCEDMDMGEPPQSLARRSGEKFELPNCGTLKKTKYAFAGWKLGSVIYTPGTIFTVIEPMEFTAVWEAKLLPTPIVDVAEYYTTEKTTVTIDYGVDGVTGYYKLDGGEPMVYNGPFEIEGTHTIVAYAIHEDYFDSAITKEYRSVRAPWTIGECLNYDGSFGDTTWVRDLEVTHDSSAAMRSGITGNKQSSQLMLNVSGAGMLTFWCKTSSEYDTDDGTVYDGMICYIDGVAQNGSLIGGDTDWTRYDFEVVGEGEHTIVWSYEKDKGGLYGEDCAWIDEVVWERKTAGGEVIGDVTALKEVFGAESSVVRNLTSDEELVKFNEFLGKCGITVASQISDKQKQYAYESFRMSAITVEPQLFENEPKLKIHEFKQGEGGWSVSISLKAGSEEIAMARKALEERIFVGNKLTEITSKPDIVASPSEDGTSLTFTIAPPEGREAFVRVRL